MIRIIVTNSIWFYVVVNFILREVSEGRRCRAGEWRGVEQHEERGNKAYFKRMRESIYCPSL